MLSGAFDPSACAGLVFCKAPGRGFAFRFAFEFDGRRFDWYDVMDIVDDIGPCAPDGSYGRLSLDPSLRQKNSAESVTTSSGARSPAVILEWSMSDSETCVGRVSLHRSCIVEFRAYFPWDWSGSWTHHSERPSVPEAFFCLTGTDSSEHDELHVSLLCTVPGTAQEKEISQKAESGEYQARIPMEAGESLCFVATVSCSQRSTAVGVEEVERRLENAEQRYADTRVNVDGHWCGLAESITNNLNWMVALKPEDGSRYTPAGRRWIFPRSGGGKDHWTVFCWDAFFNALELAVESPDLAGDTLRAVLASQYENGNIPNWRGRFFGTRDRSQPPIGSFVVLKMFLRTGDRSVLEESFPALERWSAWWRAPKGNCLRRDGNGNGLFEWGCDLDLLEHSPAPWENEASPHQFAAWESGQDDLPNWDDAKWVAETGTLDLESVDLNSLLALDFDCLRRIAELLDLAEKATAYGRLYGSLSDAMNELLWDEDRGMYVDRFWDGRLSTRLAASNFYPLVAGIAPADRAERMLDTLLDTKKFWGRFVLPSISRDDPAFNDQQYWRGTIWPPTNYLVYQGLKRYHFDEEAAILAERSVELFLGSWRRDRLCRENYDSRTGEGGGQKYQSWGPLFALAGIEQFIDVTPWDGLRIGTLFPPLATVLDRIRIGGREWRVALSHSGLSISVDGRELLVFTRPVVLRQFELDRCRIDAKIVAQYACTGTVSLGTAEVTMTLDGESAIYPASAVQIPAGEHSMSIGRIP